jgi:hypothetical protein
LLEELRMGRFRKRGGMVVTGAGEKGTGSHCLTGSEFLFGMMKRDGSTGL